MPDLGPHLPTYSEEQESFMRHMSVADPKSISDEEYDRYFHLKHEWQFPSDVLDEFVTLSIKEKRGTISDEEKKQKDSLYGKSFPLGAP